MDFINIGISDTHCGSDRAVFPPSITLPPLMADEKNRILKYSPNQKKLYNHLIYCGEQIAKRFPNHKKIVTHNGDAIEGLHHRTIQLSAPMIDDHVIIHEEVMSDFLAAMKFNISTDELNYVSGTEAHTGYTESRIAKKLGGSFFDELKLTQNGRKIWFVHQWGSAGNGHSEGDSLRNSIKSVYYNSLKEKYVMPDVIISSHYHKATMASYSQNYKTYYGIITPSFQLKTRFSQKVSAFSRNDIGVSLIEISSSGLIGIHEPILMK